MCGVARGRLDLDDDEDAVVARKTGAEVAGSQKMFAHMLGFGFSFEGEDVGDGQDMMGDMDDELDLDEDEEEAVMTLPAAKQNRGRIVVSLLLSP